MFSAIALAPPSRAGDVTPSNDGRLEMHEVLAMEVGSRLVYLSGCETALGAATPTSSRSEEDYATLAQAFLFAGARDVVATLWRIDDRGAADFAIRFYQSLRSTSPTEALALAQRALIHDQRYAAPYYWAAYTVSGAGTIQ
jgi:CHAT domain-containing protein